MGGAARGSRLLGLAIRTDLVNKSRVDLRGKTVRTPADLARLTQVFRDPRFETLRVFYLKGTEIFAQEAVTSKMPGVGRFFDQSPKAIYQMKDRMRRLGADGYYLLHNHPSGNPKPSDEDQGTSRMIAKRVPGFKGHVVIDDTKYAVIRVKDGSSEARVMSLTGVPPSDLLTPEVPHALLGQPLEDARGVAQLGRQLATDPKVVVLFYRSAAGFVRAIQEMPIAAFSNPQLEGRLLNLQRAFGSSRVVGYSAGAPLELPVVQDFIQRGVLLDMIGHDPVKGLVSAAESLGVNAGLMTRQYEIAKVLSKPVYHVAEESAGYQGTALVRVRRQAIQAVIRELRQQAVLLNQERIGLRRRVLASGGIRPTLGGGLREELQAIRPFLRRTGQPIDALATELGFENGEALREALIAGQGAHVPSLAELRRQAEQIVSSQGGNRILEAIQAKGASGQAIGRVVKDVTAQMHQQLQAGTQQARKLLQAGAKQALTPAQLARIARAQRIEPGATTPGPRGGQHEAPLEPADVRRIAASTEHLVPREGQPTGTPPIIPRSKSLIPASVPLPQRDLSEGQATAFSGLDPSRAAQIVDGQAQGPTQRQVLKPLRTGELAFRQEQQRTLGALRQVSRNLREGSKGDRRIFRFLEGKLPADQLLPVERETAQWLAKQFDDLLERVNRARQSVGKRPVLRRENYITHIQDPSLWEAMREAFTNAPPEATKTLETAFFEQVSGRTPGFRFGLPRKGGPFQEGALRAFKAYLPAALRVIHLSEPSRLATVYVNRSLASTPKAHGYFSQLIRQTATGEQGPVARLLPKTVVRAANWLKGRFGQGTILGNFSSVLQQPFTLPATVAQAGPQASTAAAAWLARGDGMAFAMRWSPTMQARVMEMDVDFTRLASKRDAALGAMFAAADRTMVAHAFTAGYLKAVSDGATFSAALEAGEQAALRTQSSFLTADMAPVFRDTIMAGFLQFQNTINGVFNFMVHDIPKGWAGNPFLAAAAFVGTFAALTAIYEALGLPHPDEVSDFVPGLSTVRSGGPVGIRLLASLSKLGSADDRERTQAWRTLSSSLGAIAVGSGFNQASKSVRGLAAVGAGGKFDRRGRLQFPVRGLPEQARAVAFGPYGTRAGKAYIKRGFKPEPLTPAQKALNRQKAAFRRSLISR